MWTPIEILAWIWLGCVAVVVVFFGAATVMGIIDLIKKKLDE